MRESDAEAVASGVQEQRQDAETFAVQQLRAMEQPKWNEGRLDDLSKKVDDGIGRLDEERKELRGEVKEGFNAVEKRLEKVDEEFKSVRGEMKAGFERVDERFDKVGEEFRVVRGEVKAGFDRMQWRLIGVAATVIVAFIGGPHL